VTRGEECDFLRQHANPSLDLMHQAGTDTSDARYGRPAVTATDALHLLYGFVKKHRFLAKVTASCVAPADGSIPTQDLHVVVDLKGGAGQDSAQVSADPSVTDVFLEVWMDPAPSPLAFVMSQGSLAPTKEPAGGFAGGAGSGFAVEVLPTGNGRWEAWLRPTAGYASGSATFQFAVVVETKTVSGQKDAPASYKAWLGTSMAPLATEYGVSYDSLWGGSLSAVPSQGTTCSILAPSSPAPPVVPSPSSPPPPLPLRPPSLPPASPPCGLLELSGYSCSGAGPPFTVNQRYAYHGETADGRPYYQGLADPSAYVFYTSNCGGLAFDVWGVFQEAPSQSATENVSGESGQCSAAAMSISSGLLPPQARSVWYTNPCSWPLPAEFDAVTVFSSIQQLSITLSTVCPSPPLPFTPPSSPPP